MHLLLHIVFTHPFHIPLDRRSSVRYACITSNVLSLARHEGVVRREAKDSSFLEIRVAHFASL